MKNASLKSNCTTTARSDVPINLIARWEHDEDWTLERADFSREQYCREDAVHYVYFALP